MRCFFAFLWLNILPISIYAQEIEKLGADDLSKNTDLFEQIVISASRTEKKSSRFTCQYLCSYTGTNPTKCL